MLVFLVNKSYSTFKKLPLKQSGWGWAGGDGGEGEDDQLENKHASEKQI